MFLLRKSWNMRLEPKMLVLSRMPNFMVTWMGTVPGTESWHICENSLFIICHCCHCQHYLISQGGLSYPQGVNAEISFLHEIWQADWEDSKTGISQGWHLWFISAGEKSNRQQLHSLTNQQNQPKPRIVLKKPSNSVWSWYGSSSLNYYENCRKAEERYK